MAFVISIPAESQTGEQRVAATPDQAAQLLKIASEVRIYHGAGVHTNYSDNSYTRAGAKVVQTLEDLYADTGLALRVKRGNPENEAQELKLWQPGMALVGFLDPQTPVKTHLGQYAESGITALTFELMPQNEHTQSMHATAAMSRITGQVVIAEANTRLKGLDNKNILVVGMGNAGVEAAIKAAEMGANVTALSTTHKYRDRLLAEGINFQLLQDERNGTMSPNMALRLQQSRLADFLPNQDVIVCAARRVGLDAPMLIPAENQSKIKNGALVYDLTASSGGNCQGNVYGTDTPVGHFTICSKKGYPKAVPGAASIDYGNCAVQFLRTLFDHTQYVTAKMDAIRDTCMVTGGKINPATNHPNAVSKGDFESDAYFAIRRLRELVR